MYQQIERKFQEISHRLLAHGRTLAGYIQQQLESVTNYFHYILLWRLW